MGDFPFSLGPLPDQAPASDYATTPAGMLALAASIANRNAARVDIPVIGDSVTEGQGVTTMAARCIAQANRALRAYYPTAANGSAGASGFIPIASTGETSFAWPVTQTGGGAWDAGQPIGPVRAATAMSAAGSFSWTAPASSSSAKVMYYDNGDGSQFSWQVDGGAVTTVTVNGGTGDGALTASIPITSGQVLHIAWVAGTVYMEGIVPYSGDETSGITLHACGHYGWQAGQSGDFDAWNQTGFGPDFPWEPAIAALIPSAGAFGIMLGINDAAAYTAPGFQSNLEQLIASLRGQAALSALPGRLIIPYQPQEAFISSGGWPAYATAIRSAAAADGNSTVWDLSYRMPPTSVDFDDFDLYADQLHLSNLGAALAGEIVASGLRIA